MTAEAGWPRFSPALDDAWAGLSLTMPLKQAVLPLLDEVDDVAVGAGAANTVVLGEGRRSGAQHRRRRASLAALDERRGVGRARRQRAVLGAGATARSAVVALARTGPTR